MSDYDFTAGKIDTNFAENTLQQARKSYETFSEASKNAVATAQATLPGAAKEFNGKVLSFTDSNISDMFDLAEKVIRAKNMEEVLKIQTDYLQSQAKNFQEQSKELGGTLQKAFTEMSNKAN